MHDPANMPLLVMCQDLERKHASMVFQFHNIYKEMVSKSITPCYAGRSRVRSQGFLHHARGSTYADLATAAHVHSPMCHTSHGSARGHGSRRCRGCRRPHIHHAGVVGVVHCYCEMFEDRSGVIVETKQS